MKPNKLFLAVLCLILNFNYLIADEPALKINLNPPEENTKDTQTALKDLAKLEDDIRIGANDDFDEEKKKMIEIQKTRIHDIVHGAFLGLNSLIPNPIKASIRKAIRDHIGGKSSDEQISDPSKAMKAVETDKTNTDIRKQQEKIRKIDEPKFKQLMINNNKNKKNLSKSNSNRINSKEIVDDITKKYFSDSKMKYLTFNFILDYEQQDNYYDANGSEKLDENEELSIMNSGVRRPF